MAILQRFQISGFRCAAGRPVVAVALALALVAANGCKKSGDAADASATKKPPIVKAKKGGVDAKAPVGPAAADGAAKAKGSPGPATAPTVASPRPPAPRPAGVAEAPTPAVAPPAVVLAPAAAPVVPVPVGRGKPDEVAAKAAPGKLEPAKLEPAKVEPPKVVAQPVPKVEEPALPPGAISVHAVPTEAPLDVNGYIIAADLPKVLGPKQKFHRTELVGINPTPNYNAMFYATDKQDLFGVSVQVWRDPNLAESRTRFNTMKNSYSNVSPTNKITDMGFRSFYGNVVTLVFVDPRRPLLAAVSCSTKVCGGDQMIELARRVAERLH